MLTVTCTKVEVVVVVAVVAHCKSVTCHNGYLVLSGELCYSPNLYASANKRAYLGAVLCAEVCVDAVVAPLMADLPSGVTGTYIARGLDYMPADRCTARGSQDGWLRKISD